jgi:site-specific recombinase XerD
VVPRTAADGSRLCVRFERDAPLTRQAAWRIIKEAGGKAGIELEVHPHMLKHSCGFYLANRGLDTRLIQDYMGHKQI